MNLPVCPQRAKPTFSLLTSNSSGAGPQPYTFLPDPSERHRWSSYAPTAHRDGAGGLGSWWLHGTGHHTTSIFIYKHATSLAKAKEFILRKKAKRKGKNKVFGFKTLFFACGQCNPATRTSGRRSMRPRKDTIRLLSAFKVIILVLFKTAL